MLLAMRKVRESQGGLFIAALMVVSGFIFNRLNVSITGMLKSSGVEYFPSFMEIGVTVFLVAMGFVAFAAAVKFLPIFPEEEESEATETADALEYFVVPARESRREAEGTGVLAPEMEN